MTITLIGLHGFTLNGAVMSETVAPLRARCSERVQWTCPDGPNACSDTSVQRMERLFGSTTPAPHCCWFDASDDGRQYHGFEHTKLALAARIEAAQGPVGLLGFSQGAIAAASLAALAANGQFPALSFVVLIAGRTPRADDIAPLLKVPLTIPSLHVWGERDPFAAHASELVERFEPATRHVVAWPGPHTIPTRGSAADRIVEFITTRA